MRIGGEQTAVDLRDAAFHIDDPDVPVAWRSLRRRTASASLCVHQRQHLAVGDQISAIDDRLKRPIIDLAGSEDFGHLWQPLAHGSGIPQPATASP